MLAKRHFPLRPGNDTVLTLHPAPAPQVMLCCLMASFVSLSLVARAKTLPQVAIGRVIGKSRLDWRRGSQRDDVCIFKPPSYRLLAARPTCIFASLFAQEACSEALCRSLRARWRI